METNISWRHMEHSPELAEKIKQKMSKVHKFSDRILSSDVIFTKNMARILCEIHVKLEKAPIFVIKEESYNILESIDKAIDKLQRKIKEYEKKTRERKSGKLSRQ